MGRENVPDELTDQAKGSSRQELWKVHLATSHYLFTVKCEGVLSHSVMSLCGPMECSSPGSSVHGIFQERNTGGGCIPTPGDLPDPGTEPCLLHCLHWQAVSLPLVPPGKQVTGAETVKERAVQSGLSALGLKIPCLCRWANDT